MSDEIIALTTETFERFDRAARAVESAAPRARNLSVHQSPIIQYIKVAAGAVNSYGYPAYIQKTTDNGLNWSNQSATVVRVRTAGDVVLSENDYINARFVGINASNVGCFFAVAFGDIATIDYIAKACVTRNSGVVTNITFEHKQAKIWGMLLPDETYCTDGDDDCCPTITTVCCPDTPNQLTLTISASGDFASWDGLKICFAYDPCASECLGEPVWTPTAASVTPTNIFYANCGPDSCNYVSFYRFQSVDGGTTQTLDVGQLRCVSGVWTGYVPGGVGSDSILWFQHQTVDGTCTVNDPAQSGMGLNLSNNPVVCDPFLIDNDQTKTISCSGGTPPTGNFNFTIQETVDGDCTGLSSDCPCAECPGVEQWYLTDEIEPLICVDTTGWPGWEAIDCFYAQLGYTGWALMHSTATGYWQLINLSTSESYSMIDTAFTCAGPNEFDVGFTVTLTP